MDPLKLISYIAGAGVVTLIAMGAAGFYAGYSAGRGDLSEIKSYLATANFSPAAGPSPEPASRPVTAAVDLSTAPDFSPVISEIRALASQMKNLEKIAEAPAVAPAAASRGNADQVDLSPLLSEIKSVSGAVKKLDKPFPVPAAPDLSPVLAEVKALSEGLKRVEKAAQQSAASAQQTISAAQQAVQQAAQQAAQQSASIAEKAAEKNRDDPKLREELGRLKQLAASTADQLNACQVKMTSLEARLIPAAALQNAAGGRADATVQTVAKVETAAQDADKVMLYDSFYLKKDQNKEFSDVDLNVSLLGVASRSARVDINKQPVSIAFGERKEIVYNNMTCELNLMETDLGASQARFNIACKR